MCILFTLLECNCNKSSNMSLSNKEFKLVCLPPETYSSTSTSPSYGISSEASRRCKKSIAIINENSTMEGVDKHKQNKMSIVKNFSPVVSHDGYKTDIRTTKYYIEDEDTSVYCLSDVSSLDLNCKEDKDEDSG